MVTKVKDPGKPPQISLELEIVGASLCSAPKPAIFEHLYLKPKECSSKLLRVRVSLWEGRRAPSSSSVFPTQRHEHSRDSRPGLGSASKYIYMCQAGAELQNGGSRAPGNASPQHLPQPLPSPSCKPRDGFAARMYLLLERRSRAHAVKWWWYYYYYYYFSWNFF